MIVKDKRAVIECFSALLDATTATSSSNNDDANSGNVRENLITSLHSLHKIYEKKNNVSSSNNNDGINIEWLLQVEEASRDLRECMDNYSLTLQQERSDVGTLCQELEYLCQDNDTMIRFVGYCQSLTSEFFKQSYLEENVMDRILQQLLHLYDDDEFQPNFQSTAQMLDTNNNQHHCFNKDQKREQGVLLLEALKGRKKNPPRTVDFKVEARNPPCSKSNEEKEELIAVNKNELVVTDDSNMMIGLYTASTPQEAVQSFLNTENDFLLRSSSTGTFFRFQKLLLMGPEGCGLTHICNEIECMAEESSNALVIRPSLPVDILGTSVGATEDIVVSLFNCALSMAPKRCVLILDDITQLIGSSGNINNAGGDDGGDSHLSVRARSCFLSMMDSLEQRKRTEQLDLLLVCTARKNRFDGGMARFDRIMLIEPPKDHERRKFMLSSLGIIVDDDDLVRETDYSKKEEIETLVNGLVVATIRMSYAELSQHIRQAIMTVSSSKNGALLDDSFTTDRSSINRTLHTLRALKDIVQSIYPASLRNILVDDFMEMRISTAKDLLAEFDNSGDARREFPFFGTSLELAWEDLKAHIVTPLCRGAKLQQIMNKHAGIGSSSGSMVCGGVLLTGPPGSGKSAMARYCAMVAAKTQHLPNIKLLEASCTSLIHKEVGSSERAVRRLFDCARSATPCILLLDEISSIAAVRGHDYTTEGTMDRVLSTVLTEMDGINEHDNEDGGDEGGRGGGGLAIIGITQSSSWIDPALKRPGRLAKVIHLELPDREARGQIVQQEFQTFELGKSQLAESIVEQTTGMSAASVIALCNETKLKCLQQIQKSGGGGDLK